MQQLAQQLCTTFASARDAHADSEKFANEARLAVAILQLARRLRAANAPPAALLLAKQDGTARRVGVSLPFVLLAVHVLGCVRYELEFDGIGSVRFDAWSGVLRAALLEAKVSARKGAAGDAAEQLLLERARVFAAVAAAAAPLLARPLSALPAWLLGEASGSLTRWWPRWLAAGLRGVDVRGSVVLLTPLAAKQRDALVEKYTRRPLCNSDGAWLGHGLLSISFWTLAEGPPPDT